jgi:hypothetical protein
VITTLRMWITRAGNLLHALCHRFDSCRRYSFSFCEALRESLSRLASPTPHLAKLALFTPQCSNRVATRYLFAIVAKGSSALSVLSSSIGKKLSTPIRSKGGSLGLTPHSFLAHLQWESWIQDTLPQGVSLFHGRGM